MQSAFSVSLKSRKTISGVHVLPQVHGRALTLHVRAWSTGMQVVAHVERSACAGEAVSPLPVTATPRATSRCKARVEVGPSDYWVASQIAAVLELRPQEAPNCSMLLSLERAARHIGTAKLYASCQCQRAAVCTSTSLNLRESTRVRLSQYRRMHTVVELSVCDGAWPRHQTAALRQL